MLKEILFLALNFYSLLMSFLIFFKRAFFLATFAFIDRKIFISRAIIVSWNSSSFSLNETLKINGLNFGFREKLKSIYAPCFISEKCVTTRIQCMINIVYDPLCVAFY